MSALFEPPKNGIYIILGEIQALTSSKKINNRWQSNQIYEESIEMDSFEKLKVTLNSIADLRDIDSMTFLLPFLEIIRSDEISGPVTCLALNSVNKFVTYGLIDYSSENSASTIDKVALAVTHTRFVGTNSKDDEVVLMRILQVLRSLLLSQIGSKMTNEVVCEILQSCFRLCFETRLSELLRKTSEHVLVDMIQLLFARLPQFRDDQLSIDQTKSVREQTNIQQNQSAPDQTSKTNLDELLKQEDNERPTAIDSATHVIPPTDMCEENENPTETISTPENTNQAAPFVELESGEQTTSTNNNEFVNQRDIRFSTSTSDNSVKESLKPYSWICARDLLRFLTTLINNHDKNNSDQMKTVGLNLLTVALEVGADHLALYPSIVAIVKDNLCRNLIGLLHSTRLTLFSAALRVLFLLFESLRTHLKLQFEFFLKLVMEIIVSEQMHISNEHKEIALESIIQLLRIPGLAAELYLNYDCDLYSTNLFEDLTKLLSKNAFPVAGLTSIHVLSLDALLSVIDQIEQECQTQVQRQKQEASNQSLSRPISSGYALALTLQNINLNRSPFPNESRATSRTRENRLTTSLVTLPSHEDLKKMKTQKKLLRQGSELFNQKPSSGIEFLQENGLLSNPLDLTALAKYLKENPLLDKKVIGDFISNRKNAQCLEEYVKLFNFEKMRIDEALRIYLSEFRLPGEAPLISNLLEQFAARWRECNNFMLANNDAAFGLAYACIMLNTDQHNQNVRRQIPRMTCEDFVRNLSKMNNQENFDEEMLKQIFAAIRSEEIVMPSEHRGFVRETYLWKLMLKQSLVPGSSQFLHTPTGSYSYDIFTLLWGQTVAALSFVFEKSNFDPVIEKSIQGFTKCARIAAYYSMSDVFDNLVISLCKFTTLLNNREWIENVAIQFGLNKKSRLAASVVFKIAHLHGDILRDGWKNIIECIIHLYKAKLLPTELVEVEDFLHPSGRITLIKEQVQQAPKADSGLFFSLAYFLGGGSSNESSSNTNKPTSSEEQEALKIAMSCIEECHIEQILQETKFLLIESLNELLKALIYSFQSPPDNQKLDNETAVFALELLVKIVIQNRDRVTSFWTTVRNQFYTILVNATEKTFFVERTCIGILRIASRLLRREELVSEVFDSLRILLLMKSNVINELSPEISFGLHELLRTDAANIHQSHDWFILFSLLEVVGAAAPIPAIFQNQFSHGTTTKGVHQTHSMVNADSDSECSDCMATVSTDKGYTSDSEIYRRPDYVVVSHDDLKSMRAQSNVLHRHKTDGKEMTLRYDRRALAKSCEILTFLIRDLAYLTTENFEYCIHCIRTFIEVIIVQRPTGTSRRQQRNANTISRATSSNNINADYSIDQSNYQRSQNRSESPTNEDLEDLIREEMQNLASEFLTLLDTLHTRAVQIYKYTSLDQSKASVLWSKCWCPILQGIARLCCDPRRNTRTFAFNYLQRSILLPELQFLPATEWESVFNKVLFPLLNQLLETVTNGEDNYNIEEIRVRVSQLLCRIFLQHLNPLLTLPTFTVLWLNILDFMDKYSKLDQTDHLRESIRESLKNMLLVMNTTNLFEPTQPLTLTTKERIHSFLPGLWEDVFKVTTPPTSPSITVPAATTISETTNSDPPRAASNENSAPPLTNSFFPSSSSNFMII